MLVQGGKVKAAEIADNIETRTRASVIVKDNLMRLLLLRRSLGEHCYALLSFVVRLFIMSGRLIWFCRRFNVHGLLLIECLAQRCFKKITSFVYSPVTDG